MRFDLTTPNPVWTTTTISCAPDPRKDFLRLTRHAEKGFLSGLSLFLRLSLSLIRTRRAPRRKTQRVGWPFSLLRPLWCVSRPPVLSHRTEFHAALTYSTQSCRTGDAGKCQYTKTHLYVKLTPALFAHWPQIQIPRRYAKGCASWQLLSRCGAEIPIYERLFIIYL